MSTPERVIAAMVRGGQEIDQEYPGLRSRDADHWMRLAAGRARYYCLGIGRKRAGPTRPVSVDTMAYQAEDDGPMSCVSIIRDNPPENEWRTTPLDYGVVGPEQEFVPVALYAPSVLTSPPADSTLEARVKGLEVLVSALSRVAIKGGDRVGLRSIHGGQVCAEPDGRVVADRGTVGPWEQFTISRED